MTISQEQAISTFPDSQHGEGPQDAWLDKKHHNEDTTDP